MFFDRPPEGERAVLLHVREPRDSYESNVAEFEELVSSADLVPMEVMLAVRSRPNPRFYIGLGKAEELKKLTVQRDAQLVIINLARSSYFTFLLVVLVPSRGVCK